MPPANPPAAVPIAAPATLFLLATTAPRMAPSPTPTATPIFLLLLAQGSGSANVLSNTLRSLPELVASLPPPDCCIPGPAQPETAKTAAVASQIDLAPLISFINNPSDIV